jgi:hypothetical protein
VCTFIKYVIPCPLFHISVRDARLAGRRVRQDTAKVQGGHPF